MSGESPARKPWLLAGGAGALLLALGLNSITYGRTLLRLGFLMPWIVAPSIGSVIWVWLLEPQFGVINYILESAGLIRETALWLADPVLALVSVDDGAESAI